jgi:hypothetical protein
VLAQRVDGAERHFIVCRNDRVKPDAAREQRLHGGVPATRSEAALHYQLGLDRKTVARHGRFICAQAHL